jgi:hypothetical protein
MFLQKQNDNVSGEHTKQMNITRNRRRSYLRRQQCQDLPRLLLRGAVLINISRAQSTTAVAAAWLRHKKPSQGTFVFGVLSQNCGTHM